MVIQNIPWIVTEKKERRPNIWYVHGVEDPVVCIWYVHVLGDSVLSGSHWGNAFSIKPAALLNLWHIHGLQDLMLWKHYEVDAFPIKPSSFNGGNQEARLQILYERQPALNDCSPEENTKRGLLYQKTDL